MLFAHLDNFTRYDAIVEFFLLFLIIFTPLAKGTFNGLPVVVVHVVSFIILISLIIKIRESKSWKPLKTPLDYPIIFFFVFAVTSFIFSLDHTKSLTGIVKLLDCIIIFYVTAASLDTKEKLRLFIYLIIFVGALISFLGLIQYIGGINWFWWVSKRELSATFENSNYFAGYLAMVIFLTMSMLFNDMKSGQRVIVFYLFLIMLVAFFLSLSRGGWISLLPAIVIVSILIVKNNMANNRKQTNSFKIFILMPFICVIGFLIIFFGFINLANQVSDTMKGSRCPNLQGRIKLWKNASIIIADYPVLGAGIDVFTNFKSPIPAKLKCIDSYSIKDIQNTLLAGYDGYDGMCLWNQYIQIASEMGIGGLLCFLWLIIQGIYASFKVYNQKRDHFKRNVCIGIIGAQIATIVHMFSANILNFMSNSILISMLMGIIFSKYCNRRKLKLGDSGC